MVRKEKIKNKELENDKKIMKHEFIEKINDYENRILTLEDDIK